MRIRPVGAYALLLDCADQDEALAWHDELCRRRDTGDLAVDEIVPAATTVLLDGLADPAATGRTIARWTPAVTRNPAGGQQALTPRSAGPHAAARYSDAPYAPGPTVDIPVTFDGADLPTVAGHWQVDVPAVVDRLRHTPFRVAFCGFAPGFGYLTGLPAHLAVPRLATPRPRVPAGSVALAGPYAGIYPGTSPGGWLLVGRTDVPLFDIHREPPALLSPGTRVRLVDA
ncbi:5-oxoprolinase subunit B family protein [Micromonospora echinofusca]|uniref:Carboxyltransferase domain-containing protein n=1 Tax=Micromonospora echinofusca TaxID=47858 RepID=A0ABS3VMX8_MICEH|nr:allophanate hydrolase subunit 1 [Micromonospora echinofusca]MBO4205857.1 carboxyltransferase domain-containing protein [Micromonospora echinofusca]